MINAKSWDNAEEAEETGGAQRYVKGCHSVLVGGRIHGCFFLSLCLITIHCSTWPLTQILIRKDNKEIKETRALPLSLCLGHPGVLRSLRSGEEHGDWAQQPPDVTLTAQERGGRTAVPAPFPKPNSRWMLLRLGFKEGGAFSLGKHMNKVEATLCGPWFPSFFTILWQISAVQQV